MNAEVQPRTAKPPPLPLSPKRQLSLAKRARSIPRDVLAYVRLRENYRTVQWLADAGVLDMNKPLVRYETKYCRHVLWAIPNFAQAYRGETRWAAKLPRPSTRHSGPRTAPRSLPPPVRSPLRGGRR